jgi:pimeloyl-ACP methyl ester carboxylesterase
MEIKDGFLEIEAGRRLHYLERDGTTGRPYLLLHGLASTATFWKPVMRELPGDVRVVALEQRGHGLSTATREYSNPGLVADVVDAIERLGLGSVNLVSHSWGADVAMQVAARHPSLVTSLALVDGGIWDLGKSMTWEECRVAMAPPDLSRLRVEDIVAYIRSQAGEVAPDLEDLISAGFAVQADGSVRARLARADHLKILRSMWEHSPTSDFALVTCPTLVCLAGQGPEEMLRRKREAAASAERFLADSRVEWMDSGHDIPLFQPRELAARLLANADRAAKGIPEQA